MSTFSGNSGPEEEIGTGWGGLVPTKAERAEERRLERERQAKNYATALAISLHDKHFPEVTQWKPLPDLLGVLTQIDNMVSVLARPTPDYPFGGQGGGLTTCDMHDDESY